MKLSPLMLLAAGWLATALAAADADIEAGIAAYEVGEHERALEHYAAAEDRRGERAEIAYDQALVHAAAGASDEATAAFERGTESDDAQVRSSSHYGLGNLALAAEQWDAAIAHYVACLRSRPEHHNAKWNLEIALQNREENKQDEENEDQKDPEQDDQEQDENEGQTGEEEDQPQTSGGDEEQEQEEQGEDEPPDQPDQQDQEPPPQPDEEKAPPPTEINEQDIDKALEQLDNEDNFLLGQPPSAREKVEKDW